MRLYPSDYVGQLTGVLMEASQAGHISANQEADIVCFKQSWSSTALAFPGIGGQAITSALTVMIFHGNDCWVYVGGRFAYHTPSRAGREYAAKLRVPRKGEHEPV